MLFELEDNILLVKLQNGRTNSFTYEELTQLQNAVDKVNQTEDIQGLILTGTGAFYSSGFDLPGILNFKTIDDVKLFIYLAEQVLLNLFSCSKPVVAAINGHCMAAGMMTAMAADYRIGVNNSKIKLGMSEIKIGLALMPAMNEIVRFGLDSNRLFRDVMFSGKTYDIIEAHSLGMIDEMTDANSLLPRAKELISGWINTPRRVFIDLKRSQKKHIIQQIISESKSYNWEEMMQSFFNDEVKKALAAVQKSMER